MITLTELDKPLIRMPSFAAGQWLGTPKALSRDALRGKVVLVDFWDYSCVNCTRTLPYLREWHERYNSLGLVIVGVHAPEFRFARDSGQIEAAIGEFALPYPVLVDNAYETWERFANRAWPTKYLIDPKGYVRLKRSGEGHYAELEAGIQQLLRVVNPSVSLPDLLPALRPEDIPGAVCYRPTPELHAGYRGSGLRGSALGNGDPLGVDQSIYYELPPAAEMQPNYFYAGGFWHLSAEALAFSGERGGQIVLPYMAAGVNAVLSPSADLVALRLGLLPEEPPSLVITLDDEPLSALTAGSDIQFNGTGTSYVRVDRPRLYELIRAPDFGRRRLTLTTQAPAIALYTFTFSTCVAAAGTTAATFKLG